MACGEEELLARWRDGDDRALGDLFALHRARLERHVHFRMDRRLASRIDPDDVLQEAYLAAAQRARHYLDSPTHSLFVWLRMIVSQTLTDLHRQHLGAKRRDAGREVRLGQGVGSGTSASLALHLAGSMTSPSQVIMRAERAVQLERALADMNATDQEILALRHFEELTNGEVAEVLDLQPKAASIRYIRAIRRLKDILVQVPDLGEALSPPGGSRDGHS